MEPLLEKNKIYIRGLPEIVTENALSDYFEKYGQVLKATVAMDGLTRKPKDFGFVWFADEASAKAAIEDLEDHVILGTKVEVKEAIRRERSTIHANGESVRNDLTRGKKIFVGGLPPDLTTEEFISFFESFGKTTDVVIIADKESRKPRGFGFVTYESGESVGAVLRTSRYLIHGKEVEVKVAIPKVSNTTVHPQGQHHPSAGVNGYRHGSSFRPMYDVIVGPPYANSAPTYPYAYSMVAPPPGYAYSMAAPLPVYAYSMATPSPAHAVNGFHGYNGYAGTSSNGNRVAPRPFTKIRISKPPGVNVEDTAGSLPASCVEEPSSASKDSKNDGRRSPSGINDGKDQASSLENGQNDS